MTGVGLDTLCARCDGSQEAERELNSVYSAYRGFVRVHVCPKKGSCALVFIKFNSIEEASEALKETTSLVLQSTNSPAQPQFAKRSLEDRR